jgi:hypothetical protein
MGVAADGESGHGHGNDYFNGLFTRYESFESDEIYPIKK